MADDEGSTAKRRRRPRRSNEYGQTEEQFKEAHGGRSPEEVQPPAAEPDEAHQEAKRKARWG